MVQEHKCPSCGQSFQRIGGHWARSSNCDYPDYPQQLLDVLVGIYSTKGNMHYGDKTTPNFRFGSSNRELMEVLSNVFGCFVGEIGQETESDYHNRGITYVLTHRSHPVVMELDSGTVQNQALFYKVLFSLRGGVTTNGYYLINVKEDRCRDKDALLESANHHWVEDDGTLCVRYTLDVYERAENANWPSGWWNNR